LIEPIGMSMQPPEDLFERCFKFTCDVYDYCEDLVKLRGLSCRLAYQLFDAAGSVGANRTESKSAYSDKEFASKNAICLKESREARFWLRVADAKRLGDERRRRYLLQESNELVSIYVVIVRKLRLRRNPSSLQRPSTSDFVLRTYLATRNSHAFEHSSAIFR
jgi:four helix bundle protein